MAKKNQASAKWQNRIVGSEMVAGDQLLANPRNWRIHPQTQQDALGKVLGTVGWVQNVIVNKRTGFVLDGHLRAAMAISAGENVPVSYVDLSPEEETLILATFDRLTAMAGVDSEKLNELVAEAADNFPDLADLLGNIDDLVAGSGGTDGLTEDDACPEVQEAVITTLGDCWLLGAHRLLCGDSTDVGTVDRLMGGKKADMVFTDPPYGLSIVKTKGIDDRGVVGGGKPYGKSGVVGGKNIVNPKQYAEVLNDDSPDTARAFYHCAVAAGMENFIIFGGNYFTTFLAPSPCWVIWDKQNSGNFADVEMAWTSFDKGAKLYSWLWNGLSRAGDRKTELKTRVHPTQKPVGLFEKIFADFPFAICYDGFLGSGSTLIACEKTGRTCYGMELDPHYCDVIIRRWQEYTGKHATLDGHGATFDQIAAERQPVAA